MKYSRISRTLKKAIERMAIPGAGDTGMPPSGTNSQETAVPAKSNSHTKVIAFENVANISLQQIDKRK